MKFNRVNRIFAALMAVLLLCVSVPAQYSLGTRRMVSRPTPTLVNRGRLSTVLGPRPRIGFVGRVGGIASDGVAAPEQGLVVNTIVASYSASQPDGQRLSVNINGETVNAPIYDWQLIPIAKFADSDSFSCFTYFGDNRLGNTSAYHAAFKDTLVGLRLFQLDSLIEDDNATDLVKYNGAYVLGAGESAPNKEENEKGLKAYEDFYLDNIALFRYRSYVISDYQRTITFGVDGNSLKLKGEPSFYFWKVDPDSIYQFKWGTAKETVRKTLGMASRYTRTTLINQTLSEVSKYDEVTEQNGFLDERLSTELKRVVQSSDQQRATLLRTKSHAALFNLLVEIKAFNGLEWTVGMPELSEKVSNKTALVRAINPAVWDTGVNLIRYAAFFRYFKRDHPQQWQAFMTQINAAPPPKPPVTTPSGFER